MTLGDRFDSFGWWRTVSPVRRWLGPLGTETLLILLVAAMMAAPAVWNGYPLIYHDTEDYVTMSFTWDPPLWRTVPYALVAWLGRPFSSLWAVVGAQALFGAWVLHELVHAFLPRRRGVALVAGSAVLVVLTGLPWMTSEVMPDAFAGFVPLIVGILAFGHGLSRWRRALLTFFGAVAIMVHMSHVAVAAGLLLVLACLWAVSLRFPSLPRPVLRLVVTCVVAGTLAVPAVHLATTGKPYFSRSGRVLQLALFIQNGLAKTYLDAVCPHGIHLKLCPYRDNLPQTADAFLWAHWASPFWRLGGWTGMENDAEQIVDGTIHDYPGYVAKAAAENAWDQYWEIKLGDGLGPKNRAHWPGEYRDVGASRYPWEMQDYLAARQQQPGGIDFAPLNVVQIPVALIGRIFILILTLLAFRRADRAAVGLGVVVVLALIGNAVVCGAVSNPHERYQNRIVWDALAASMVLAGRVGGAMRLRVPEADIEANRAAEAA